MWQVLAKMVEDLRKVILVRWREIDKFDAKWSAGNQGATEDVFV